MRKCKHNVTKKIFNKAIIKYDSFQNRKDN